MTAFIRLVVAPVLAGLFVPALLGVALFAAAWLPHLPAVRATTPELKPVNPYATPRLEAKPVNLSGIYHVTGHEPVKDGKVTYAGSCTIHHTDEQIHVTYTSGASFSQGTGVYRDGHLAVGWVQLTGHPVKGVTMYRVLDGGKCLEGVWASSAVGLKGERTETLRFLSSPEPKKE